MYHFVQVAKIENVQASSQFLELFQWGAWCLQCRNDHQWPQPKLQHTTHGRIQEEWCCYMNQSVQKEDIRAKSVHDSTGFSGHSKGLHFTDMTSMRIIGEPVVLSSEMEIATVGIIQPWSVKNPLDSARQDLGPRATPVWNNSRTRVVPCM